MTVRMEKCGGGGLPDAGPEGEGEVKANVQDLGDCSGNGWLNYSNPHLEDYSAIKRMNLHIQLI